VKKHAGPEADLKLHIHQLHPAAAAAATTNELSINRSGLRKSSHAHILIDNVSTGASPARSNNGRKLRLVHQQSPNE
jgi:hypothetical protein